MTHCWDKWRWQHHVYSLYDWFTIPTCPEAFQPIKTTCLNKYGGQTPHYTHRSATSKRMQSKTTVLISQHCDRDGRRWKTLTLNFLIKAFKKKLYMHNTVLQILRYGFRNCANWIIWILGTIEFFPLCFPWLIWFGSSVTYNKNTMQHHNLC